MKKILIDDNELIDGVHKKKVNGKEYYKAYVEHDLSELPRAPEFKVGDIVKIKKGILTYLSCIKSWTISSIQKDLVRLKSENTDPYTEVSVFINQIYPHTKGD